MKIEEEVVTRATPRKAWDLISDPSLHTLWNPHIVATDTAGSDTPGPGQRYRVTYELSGKRTELEAQVIEFSPETRWVARLEERIHGTGEHFDRYMVEQYTLAPHRGGTRVRHEVVIHHSGVNVFLRALIWFVMKTGKPQGQPFLDRFRELAEDEGPAGSHAAGAS